MRALIVEDEIFSANNLKCIISKADIETIAIVDNAKDAMKICKEHKPDLILMDIMIKGAKSGVELAVDIKHMISEDIFIIFLTAYSDKEMISYAVNANAFAYLLKPYREGEIIATLELVKSKYTIFNKESIPKNSHIVKLIENYSFDTNSNTLYQNNVEIAISRKSQRLLNILSKNSHIFVSSQEIINYVWENSSKGNMQTLRSLIYRLKNLTKSNLIKSHNNIGYKVVIKRE